VRLCSKVRSVGAAMVKLTIFQPPFARHAMRPPGLWLNRVSPDAVTFDGIDVTAFCLVIQ
jgi:hypothetical protein